MVYQTASTRQNWVFADLKELMAKATPPRSGDMLAGIAAGSAEEAVAARICLADVPLKQFLTEAVVPYETDEITRLIIDAHDAAAFASISLTWLAPRRNPLRSTFRTVYVTCAHARRAPAVCICR